MNDISVTTKKRTAIKRVLTSFLLGSILGAAGYFFGYNGVLRCVSVGLICEAAYAGFKGRIPAWASLLGCIYASLPLFLPMTYSSFAIACTLAVVADTAGYVFGNLIGGPKLCPSISPNKTKSGAVAGLAILQMYAVFLILTTTYPGDISLLTKALSALFPALYCFWFYKKPLAVSILSVVALWVCILLPWVYKILSIWPWAQGALGSMLSLPIDVKFLSQALALSLSLSNIFIICLAGDLLVSIVKRKNNLKDTSNILPGHGGLWDRFDSHLAVLCYIGLIIFVNTRHLH